MKKTRKPWIGSLLSSQKINSPVTIVNPMARGGEASRIAGEGAARASSRSICDSRIG